MATHNIHATVDLDIDTFRTALKPILSGLSWEYKMESENYYKLKLIPKNVHEHADPIPGSEFTDHGLSNFQKLNAQIETKIISGMNKITKRFGFLKKTVDASEKLLKGLVEMTTDSVFYPELILIPNDQSTDLTLSIKSWEVKSTFLILTYLVLKYQFQQKSQAKFSGYEYVIKKAKKSKIAPTSDEPTAEKPKEAVPEKPPPPSEKLLSLATELKVKVSENELQTCFDKMDDLYEKIQGELFGDYLVLKSDFNRLERDVVSGVISYQDAQLRRNQLNHRFLQLIDLLDEDEAIVRGFR